MISELDRNLISLQVIADVLTKMADDLKRDNDEALKEPTWDDVENYFDGPECDKCCYFMRLRDEFGGHVRCYLLRPWDGRGRAPEPSDCRGVGRE